MQFNIKSIMGCIGEQDKKTNLQAKMIKQLTSGSTHDIVIAYAKGEKRMPTDRRIFYINGNYRSS